MTEGSYFKEIKWGLVPPLHKFPFLVSYGDPAPSNRVSGKKGVKKLGLETCMTLGRLTQEQTQALADAGKSLEDYDRITASMFRESAGTRSSRRASGSTSSKKTEAAKDEGTSAMEELQEEYWKN